MRRECVTPSASRNGDERKNSSPEAALPPSAISSALGVIAARPRILFLSCRRPARSRQQVCGSRAELIGEDTPDLAVVGRRTLAAQVGAHRPLVLPAEA